MAGLETPDDLTEDEQSQHREDLLTFLQEEYGPEPNPEQGLRGMKIIVECQDRYGTSWISTLRGDDGARFCGGGRTPEAAVRELQDRMMLHGFEQVQESGA